MKPASAHETAELLRGCAAAGRAVCVLGAATKRAPALEAEPLSTLGMDRVLEHNAGDLTAIVQPGARLADVQALFARAGQMLALDPPDAGATVGGVIAAADTGPLRHRFGAPRDLVLGVQVVLSDGAVARAGGRVIKNVAGYDLAKLFAGSRGTLGVITELALRLHPLSRGKLTLTGSTDDPDALARAALALAHAPLEADCLDAAWSDGRGRLLVKLGEDEADGAAALMAGLDDVGQAADAVWVQQRAAQVGAERVPYLPSELAQLIRRAGRLVARAGIGVAWVPPGTVGRRPVDPGADELMRRVKARFDPAGILI